MRCPHCGVEGHWPQYVRDELDAGRCPDSGLPMSPERVGPDTVRYMCGVCDCFGYKPSEVIS